MMNEEAVKKWIFTMIFYAKKKQNVLPPRLCRLTNRKAPLCFPVRNENLNRF
jgi:hypothetical protein